MTLSELTFYDDAFSSSMGIVACDIFPNRIRNQTGWQCARVAAELHGIASSSLTVSQLQLLISIITGSVPKLHLPKPVLLLHKVVLKHLILELTLYSFFCCLQTFVVHFLDCFGIYCFNFSCFWNRGGWGGQMAAALFLVLTSESMNFNYGLLVL
jgi:hypothetical protein